MTQFTPEKRAKFLKKLAEMPNVARAARLCGVTRQTAYAHRDKDESFSKAWDDAIEEGIEKLEEVAMRRAKKQSDTLLIFLLKAHRPDLYREQVKVSGHLTWEQIVREAQADDDSVSDDPYA